MCFCTPMCVHEYMCTYQCFYNYTIGMIVPRVYSVPLHVCLYMCASTHVPLHVCLYTYASTCVPLHMCLFICASICASTCLPLHMCLYMCLHMCLCMCASICASTCVPLHIYFCMCASTHVPASLCLWLPICCLLLSPPLPTVPSSKEDKPKPRDGHPRGYMSFLEVFSDDSMLVCVLCVLRFGFPSYIASVERCRVWKDVECGKM